MTIQEFFREKELLYVGCEEGIEGTVRTLARLGIPQSQTVEELKAIYHLSTLEANNYVQQYYH